MDVKHNKNSELTKYTTLLLWELGWGGWCGVGVCWLGCVGVVGVGVGVGVGWGVGWGGLTVVWRHRTVLAYSFGWKAPTVISHCSNTVMQRGVSEFHIRDWIRANLHAPRPPSFCNHVCQIPACHSHHSRKLTCLQIWTPQFNGCYRQRLSVRFSGPPSELLDNIT